MDSLKGKRWFSRFGQILTAIVFGFTLLACGGSSKKKDLTPNPFSFTAQVDVALSTVVESNAITVTDINEPVSISVSGGEYSVGSGAFTASSGTVTEGQSVRVRLTSSDTNSTQTSATLTIGGVSGTFSVTTLDDTSPDAFAFTAQTEISLNTVVSSNMVTITGVNVAAPIMVSGGEYSIEGSAFTSDDGTIEAGQNVVVRQTSSESPETTTEVTLTVGDVSGVFSIMTQGRYTFEGFTGVALNARLQTHIIDVTDIADSTPISIENGEYSIERGAFTSDAGFIDNNQSVRVRTRVGAEYNETTTARLEIGDSWGLFNVTTKENGDFVSVWQTDNPGASDDNQIRLAIDNDGTYDFTVDWGDGTSDTITQWDQAEVTHTYSAAGQYTVTIRGVIIGFEFNGGGDAEKLVEIQQWGALQIGDSDSYFYGASNLRFTGTDALDLTGTIGLTDMFGAATNFDGYIGNWDVSSITMLNSFLEGATEFSGNISRWDVSQVTTLADTFGGASHFDNDISQWDVSNVGRMDGILNSSGMSTENYSRALIAWSELPNTQTNVDLGALGIFYNAAAVDARTLLINDKNWGIDDAGLEP